MVKNVNFFVSFYQEKNYTLIVQIIVTTNYDDGLILLTFFEGGGSHTRNRDTMNFRDTCMFFWGAMWTNYHDTFKPEIYLEPSIAI